MKIIDVLCTGPSLKRYIPSDNETVGVHKITQYHRVNHLLFTDRNAGFPTFIKDQLRRGYYDKFYTFSHLEKDWHNIIPIPLTILKKGKRNAKYGIDLDKDEINLSVTSSIPAVVLAYKLGATIIDLYGADFTTHQTFNPDNKNTVDKIIKRFENLQKEFIKRGVSLRVTSESVLSAVLPLIPQSKQYQGASLITSVPHF